MVVEERLHKTRPADERGGHQLPISTPSVVTPIGWSWPRWAGAALTVGAALMVALVWCLTVVADRPASHIPLVVLFILAVPLIERFAIPGDRTGYTETATFALVVGAAATVGAGAALLVAISGLLTSAQREGAGLARKLSFHAPLLVLLAIAGWLFQAVPLLVVPAAIFWGGFLAFIVTDRWRHGIAYRAGAAAIAILVIDVLFVGITMFTSLADSAAAYVDPAGTAMRFGVGFMTADTLVVSAIALARGGTSGLHFWRRELLPTFIRYNVMTAGGIAVVVGYVVWSFPGAIIGTIILNTVVIWRYERDRARRRLVATICALTTALDARDPYTKGHSDRVAAYAVGIADKLGWSRRQRQQLEIAAHLHDVGKIGVPDGVLLKPGKLTDEEFAHIQLHSAMSSDIVRNIPDFLAIARIIRQHHERLDGSGYPDAIAGAEQLPAARILAVADVYDALTSDRAYRPAMSHEQALAILQSERGWKLDADAVDALIALSEAEQLEGVLEYAYCLTH